MSQDYEHALPQAKSRKNKCVLIEWEALIQLLPFMNLSRVSAPWGGGEKRSFGEFSKMSRRSSQISSRVKLQIVVNDFVARWPASFIFYSIFANYRAHRPCAMESISALSTPATTSTSILNGFLTVYLSSLSRAESHCFWMTQTLENYTDQLDVETKKWLDRNRKKRDVLLLPDGVYPERKLNPRGI